MAQARKRQVVVYQTNPIEFMYKWTRHNNNFNCKCPLYSQSSKHDKKLKLNFLSG